LDKKDEFYEFFSLPSLIQSRKSCTIKSSIGQRRCKTKETNMDTTYMEHGHIDTIKVAAASRTSAVAGAIAGVIREHQRAEVQAIGASAVNQAVKALALAKGYLAEDGYEIVCVPNFVDVEIDGKLRTAIKFTVEPR